MKRIAFDVSLEPVRVAFLGVQLSPPLSLLAPSLSSPPSPPLPLAVSRPPSPDDELTSDADLNCLLDDIEVGSGSDWDEDCDLSSSLIGTAPAPTSSIHVESSAVDEEV